jgi:hypothetical protein
MSCGSTTAPHAGNADPAHTGNLAIAKEALAHKSIKTTLRYAHASDEDVRRGLDASESRTIPDASTNDARKSQKTAEN